jgi:Cysteine-rich CPCC
MSEHMDEEQRREMMVKEFYKYAQREEVFIAPAEGVSHRCPCCHYKTLESRGQYDICPVCFWEDDGQDDANADIDQVFGPNHMSLTQGRQNYQKIGASSQRLLQFVRPPLPEEQ